MGTQKHRDEGPTTQKSPPIEPSHGRRSRSTGSGKRRGERGARELEQGWEEGQPSARREGPPHPGHNAAHVGCMSGRRSSRGGTRNWVGVAIVTWDGRQGKGKGQTSGRTKTAADERCLGGTGTMQASLNKLRMTDTYRKEEGSGEEDEHEADEEEGAAIKRLQLNANPRNSRRANRRRDGVRRTAIYPGCRRGGGLAVFDALASEAGRDEMSTIPCLRRRQIKLLR